MQHLSPVISVDPEKCTNCHACIAACPVKYCNDGSGDHVTVNPDLCIGCGSCITACTHGARKGIDDFTNWLAAVSAGEKMIAISAPAIAANFPHTYLQVHGWLASLGVEDFFDVSFGAELTVKSYLEYARQEKPKAIIAQPCPAIVSYIELYQPELLPYLAPADSPMVHIMKMIRRYHPEYDNHKILVLSPCLAKRREFDATGLGDYNVTYASLVDYLDSTGIDLTTYPQVQFTEDNAERAVAFSTPGGLQQTVQRDNASVAAATRKIEGPEIVYDYMKKLPDMIRRGLAPALVDCLNCEMGCNGGPGTVNQDKSPDEIESLVRERAPQATAGRTTGRARRKVRRAVNRRWEPSLYHREYQNLSANNSIKHPTNAEFAEIYRRMRKHKPEDFLNCRACGYGSCEAMAIAIHNGLNRPENCFHYAQVSRTEMTTMLFDSIRESTDRLSLAITRLTSENGSGEDVEASVYAIAEISRGLREYVDKGLTYIKETIDTMKEIEQSNRDTAQRTSTLNDQIGKIGDIVKIISSIADQTKIIAFNAELEASSAGEAGQNFVIVAGEIRRLAGNTAESTRQIKEQILEIERSADHLTESRTREQTSIEQGSQTAGSLQEVFSDLSDFSARADSRIENSIQAQIRTFQQTLDELNRIEKQMDHYLHESA